MEAILAITLIVLFVVVLWVIHLRTEVGQLKSLRDDLHDRVVALDRKVEQMTKWQGGR